MNKAAHLAPTAGTERLHILDLLRGFAVFGILVMNIQAFSMIFMAAFNPSIDGDLNGANKLVWYLTYVLVEQKFYSLFTILFGAGIVLMRERAIAAGRNPRNLHYRRMLWLMLFGLIHALFIWAGDILLPYAITGMIIFFLAKKSVKTMLITAAVFFALPGLMQLAMFTLAPPDAMAGFKEMMNPTAEAIALEREAYLGSWMEQTGARAGFTLMQFFTILFGGFMRLGATMLLGMALFKTGILIGQRSRAYYLKWMLVSFVVGFGLNIYAANARLASGFEFSSEAINLLNYLVAPLIAFGYVCGANLLMKPLTDSKLGRSLQAVGRMAFSNYIMQSLICTFIFYGSGLALHGQVERTGQIAIVIAIAAFQLLMSPWWLRRFRYGPLEWLWRGLSYRDWQPLKR